MLTLPGQNRAPDPRTWNFCPGAIEHLFEQEKSSQKDEKTLDDFA